MQVLAEVHETPFSEPVDPVVWTVQVVPFQPSARVPAVPEPAAVQAEAEVQDTEFSELFAELGRFGLVWIVQDEPFQRSTSVDCAPLVTLAPTAVQADDDVQDTSLSVLLVAPARFALVWIDQDEPFHTSTSVLFPDRPAATQALADTHDRPLSEPLVKPTGNGTVLRVQDEPSQTADHSLLAPSL